MSKQAKEEEAKGMEKHGTQHIPKKKNLKSEKYTNVYE